MNRAEFLAGAQDAQGVLDRLCRHNFVSFVIRAFPYLNGGANLQMNWSIEAIAFVLEQLAKGEVRRQIICLPPRNLKSLMISVMWVAWCLGRDPTRNFVCVSYSNELAGKHARDCRAIMQSAWYQRAFPSAKIAASRSAVHDFEMTAGGGRLATSVTGTLTGRGGDTIIIDDPIKPDDALSDTVREGVNDWFSSTLASRLNDKAKGAIVVVMQRLHPFDLVGKLLEGGGWSLLSLPVIAQEEQRIRLPRNRWHRRRPGDLLHPERESLEDLMEIKRTVGSLVFAAQYLQQPVPAEGNMVKAGWLRTYETLPEMSGDGAQVVQSWDTATEEGVFNDFSVCITALVRRRSIYVLDVWRRKVPFPKLRQTAIGKAREYGAGALLIEDQSSGRQLIQSLRYEPQAGVPAPIARKPDGNKLSRMAGVSAMIEAGQLLLPRQADWLAELKAELLAFPSVRHDDQVDALTQLLTWANQDAYDVEPPICGPILFDEYGPINPPDWWPRD